jgi:hypothetical protein
VFKCGERDIENIVASNSKRVRIEIRPKVFEMPLLVRLINSILISEKTKLSGYIIIPIGIAIYARVGDSRYILDQIKPELKRVYHGQLTGEGSLSYLHYTDWHTRPPDNINVFEVIMLVEISNMNPTSYSLNSFQLSPKDIQIYTKGGIIFTNKSIVNIIREDETVIEYHMSPSIKGGRLLEDALEKHIKTVILKALDVNRYFSR